MTLAPSRRSRGTRPTRPTEPITVTMASASSANLCPIRCFCGHEVQSKYSVYCEKVRSGSSIVDALNTCGLPNSSPFAPPPGSANSYPTPPNVCCRAMMMCNSDMSSQHNLYQLIVRWAEGAPSAGSGNVDGAKDSGVKHPGPSPAPRPVAAKRVVHVS